MSIQQSTELYYLVLTTGLTSVIWIPYIINRILELGLWPALQSSTKEQPPEALWAFRMMNAHRNGIENLMIFAPLVLALNMLDIANNITGMAAMLFFYSRLAHLIIYTLGIPVLRTLSFFIGFICQMVLLVQIMVS